MQGLGYERYGARRRRLGRRGDDLHGARRPRAAARHPPLQPRQRADRRAPPLTAAERAFVAATAHWDATERGYSFDPGHEAADARLRPDRLARGARGLDPREVALAGPTPAATSSARPRLPAHARDALLGHEHDRDRRSATTIDNRDAGTARSAPTTSSPSRPRSPKFHHNHVSEGVLAARVGRAALRRRALHRRCRAAATSPPPRSRTCCAADITAFFARLDRAAGRCSPRPVDLAQRDLGSLQGESRARAFSLAAVTASTASAWVSSNSSFVSAL